MLPLSCVSWADFFDALSCVAGPVDELNENIIY